MAGRTCALLSTTRCDARYRHRSTPDQTSQRDDDPWYRIGVSLLREVWSRRVVQLAVGALVLLAFFAIATCQFARMSRHQEPRVTVDSVVFLNIAEQPLSSDYWFYAKPPLVPIVYRALAGDPATISSFQRWFALASWLLLGTILFVSLSRWRARLLALIAVLAFIWSPVRIGWTGVVLSESINDSLLALIGASCVGLFAIEHRLATNRLQSWLRVAVMTLLLATTTAWSVARDTNAISIIVSVVIVYALSRQARCRRWLSIGAGYLIVVAIATIWSTRVVPSNPSALRVYRTWSPEIAARSTFSMIDNVFMRVLPNPAATEYFRDRGMPLSQEMMTFSGDFAGAQKERFLTDATFAAQRSWIASSGARTYVSWLVLHPLQAFHEFTGDVLRIALPWELRQYMPTGWDASDPGHPWIALLRSSTDAWLVLLALVVIAVLFARRPSVYPLMYLALAFIVAGTISAMAAYFGDSIELARHCYGSVQQVLLGLVLVVIARFDGARITS